jgi:hypothetical protein
MHHRRAWNILGASAIVLTFLAGPSAAAEPLHVRIDELVAAGQVGPVSPTAGDAEFQRRVYLDLTGEIPSPADVRGFLDDSSPGKRSALVERLLASPSYARHMTHVFSTMFMERRPDKVIPAADWQQYLHKSLAGNKPYNQLAREILSADGADPALRPAAKFYLDRDGEPNALARDVGRIFFGRDLQCAQCHDHPNIDSYYQADYHGLLAFLSRGVLFTDKEKKVFFAEKADGGAAFQSVFDRDAKGETRPRLFGGQQLAEPVFAAGEEYSVKPADGVRPVPKYSRRARLAEEATSGANRAFNENIANRLWAHMLGRGLVEPVDLHHVDNPPSHPELLALLADELVAMKFDAKAFLREIALSQAYARAIDLPEPALAAGDDGLAAQLQSLEAELARLTGVADESAKAVDEVQKELRVSRATAVDAGAEVGKMTTAMTELKKASDAAQQALAQAQAALAAKQDAAAAVTEAAAKTQAAAKKLPDEKPLAEAAAKFQERAVQLAADVAAAAKAAAEKADPAKAAAEKQAAAQNAMNEAAGKQNAANSQVEGQEAKAASVIAKIEADRAKAKQIERRLQTIKSLVAYRDASRACDASQSALAKLESDVNGAKQALAKLAAELPAQKTAFDEAQKLHAEAVKSVSETQQQLNLKNDLAQTVSLAAAKAELARQKLPDDKDLAQAAQVVKTRADELVGETTESQKQFVAREQAVGQSAESVTKSKQAIDAATAEITKLEQQLTALENGRKPIADKFSADQQNLARAREDLIRYETRQFASGSLKPLTPEQLAWSVMGATGLAEQLRAASEAEVNAKTPLTDAIKNDPAQMLARKQQIDDAAYAKLQANAARFVELFGTGAGAPQDFFATADQALFFANDGQIRGWLAPGGGNLTERLGKLADDRALADELYTSILSRRPTDMEVTETANYLARRASERPAAVQELVWGLITSLEFRFNH